MHHQTNFDLMDDPFFHALFFMSNIFYAAPCVEEFFRQRLHDGGLYQQNSLVVGCATKRHRPWLVDIFKRTNHGSLL